MDIFILSFVQLLFQTFSSLIQHVFVEVLQFPRNDLAPEGEAEYKPITLGQTDNK